MRAVPGWFNGGGGPGLGRSWGHGGGGWAESGRASTPRHGAGRPLPLLQGLPLRSSVPVRSHSRQHGTAVRQDVR